MTNLEALIDIGRKFKKLKFYFRHSCLLTIFLLCGVFANAQNLDSLKTLLKLTKQDTSLVKIYTSLSENCEIDEIESFARPAIEICEKNLTDTKLKTFYLSHYAAALNNLGYYHQHYKGDIKLALDYFKKSLAVIEKNISKEGNPNDPEGLSSALNNIANIYKQEGDIAIAIVYLKKSLALEKKNEESYRNWTFVK